MKTSTLRKLPVPFVVACLLGIGVLGFLLLSPTGQQQQAAQMEADSATTNTRPPAKSPRYRSKSGVARLNRSNGATPNASQQAALEAKANQASPTRRETARQEVASQVVASQKPTRLDVAREEAPLSEDAKTEPTETNRVASTTPFRRDTNQIKSATVASTKQPASNKTYSPENPDPSELLSQIMDSDTNTASELEIGEIDETDTVMPPGFGSNEVDLAAPKTNNTDMVAKSDLQDEVSETETASVENEEASSVINGELKPEAEAPALDPAPKRVVRIINPVNNSLPVWFVTQKHKVKLKPGQRYEASTDDELQVRFARGGDLGVNRVVANDGDWVFSVTREDGWKLSQN